MPDEDNNFGGSLVLDFRKWWRHMQPKNKLKLFVQWGWAAAIKDQSSLLQNSFQWHWADGGLGFVVQNQ